MGIQEIVFQGKEYLLIGEDEGPIATRDQFANGECPFAHLYPNGDICRIGKIIGTKSDIEFKGPAQNVSIANDAINQLMTHPSWSRTEEV